MCPFIVGACPEIIFMTTVDGSNMFGKGPRVSLRQADGLFEVFKCCCLCLSHLSPQQSHHYSDLMPKVFFVLEREGEEVLITEWTIKCCYHFVN